MESCPGATHHFGRSWGERVKTWESNTFRLTICGIDIVHGLMSWGTPITVPQRAMRHGEIHVTMSYGDAVGDALREATSKVAARAIPQ
jgi:hypothetical protein